MPTTTFVIPDNTSNAGETIPSGYKLHPMPSSLSTSGKIDLYNEYLQAVVGKQMSLDKKIGGMDEKIGGMDEKIGGMDEKIKELDTKAATTITNINESSNKNIEIIGIFSSVIALLILNIGIIAIANTFLKAMLFIVALTASLSLFALLIHSLFNKNNACKLSKYFWIPFSILIVLLLLGIWTEISNWAPLKYISPPPAPEQEVGTIPQS
ncbi:hypothetical protein AGMMS4952_09430 [Spirochaetia bacterium]|nr:hypothetical protein AGMMS4952_09430 [Spirochaetia bacterium]